MVFDRTDSTIHAVIYIMLFIFTNLKLERIIGLPPQCRTWQALPFFCPKGAHIFNLSP